MGRGTEDERRKRRGDAGKGGLDEAAARASRGAYMFGWVGWFVANCLGSDRRARSEEPGERNVRSFAIVNWQTARRWTTYRRKESGVFESGGLSHRRSTLETSAQVGLFCRLQSPAGTDRVGDGLVCPVLCRAMQQRGPCKAVRLWCQGQAHCTVRGPVLDGALADWLTGRLEYWKRSDWKRDALNIRLLVGHRFGDSVSKGFAKSWQAR